MTALKCRRDDVVAGDADDGADSVDVDADDTANNAGDSSSSADDGADATFGVRSSMSTTARGAAGDHQRSRLQRTETPTFSKSRTTAAAEEAVTLSSR